MKKAALNIGQLFILDSITECLPESLLRSFLDRYMLMSLLKSKL